MKRIEVIHCGLVDRIASVHHSDLIRRSGYVRVGHFDVHVVDTGQNRFVEHLVCAVLVVDDVQMSRWPDRTLDVHCQPSEDWLHATAVNQKLVDDQRSANRRGLAVNLNLTARTMRGHMRQSFNEWSSLMTPTKIRVKERQI